MKGFPPNRYFTESNLKPRLGGFTIVELLIVVVVIAILAAITIAAYNGITERVRDSSVRSTASQIEKTIRTIQVTQPEGNLIHPDDVDSRAEFLAQNSLEQFSNQLCIDVSLDMVVEAPDCDFLGTDVGEIPKYNKSKVYLLALYNRVLISRFSYSDQSWVVVKLLLGNFEENEGEPERSEHFNPCDPFDGDSGAYGRRYFDPQDSCRRLEPPAI